MEPTGPSGKAILEYLARPGVRPGKMKELARGMRVPASSYRDFCRRIKELEACGLVARRRQNRYGAVGEGAQVAGRLRVHPRGFGLVLVEGLDADLFVPPEALRRGVDGDWVRVELMGAGERGPEARVVEIIQQTPRSMVGILVRRGQRLAVEADGRGLGRDIYVTGELPAGVQVGHQVCVSITQRGWGHDGLQGEIIDVLGAADDPGVDLLSVLRRYDLPNTDPRTDAYAGLAFHGPDVDAELGRRADLRSMRCVTIDPADARDFDDAISLARQPGGGYRLGVHIADVSHFVQPGTVLDREAFARGTSVYFLDHVIHMLPAPLAAELCSLLPQADRLAVSVLVDLDARGVVTSFELMESVVRSVARIDYEQAQQALEPPLRDAVAVEHQDLLRLMDEVSAKRRELRRRRGAIDLEIVEPRVEMGAEGVPRELGWSRRLESQRWVEELMLVANECVSQYAVRHRLPVPFRVHAPPSATRLRRLRDLVPGLPLSGNRRGASRDLSEWLRSIASRANAALLNKLLLQSMKRAVYSERHGAHFGLACDHYLHFTSPIRRYPDLLVQRVVKASLGAELDRAQRDALTARSSWVCRWSTQCEQRAEQAERTYRTIKQLRYMKRLVGGEFTGTVCGVLRRGFFVELDEFATRGFCALAHLDDYYEFDSRGQRLHGRRTGRRIQLGAAVRVRVLKVECRDQKMDLELIGESRLRRGRRRPGRRSRRSSRRRSSRRRSDR